jgi:hypothetical protein
MSDKRLTNAEPKEKKGKYRRILRGMGIVFATLLVAFVVIARETIGYAIWGFQIPTPTGKFDVGRVSWDVESPDRMEIFTDDPDDHREIRVDVYYPALDTADSEPGAYLDSRIIEGVTDCLLSPWSRSPQTGVLSPSPTVPVHHIPFFYFHRVSIPRRCFTQAFWNNSPAMDSSSLHFGILSLRHERSIPMAE